MSIIAAILGGSVIVVLAIISGALAINNNLHSIKLELAVIREREDERDKKIAKMWDWWLETLHNGWIAEMRRVAPPPN